VSDCIINVSSSFRVKFNSRVQSSILKGSISARAVDWLVFNGTSTQFYVMPVASKQLRLCENINNRSYFISLEVYNIKYCETNKFVLLKIGITFPTSQILRGTSVPYMITLTTSYYHTDHDIHLDVYAQTQLIWHYIIKGLKSISYTWNLHCWFSSELHRSDAKTSSTINVLYLVGYAHTQAVNF